jgi:hypothetical protein
MVKNEKQTEKNGKHKNKIKKVKKPVKHASSV